MTTETFTAYLLFNVHTEKQLVNYFIKIYMKCLLSFILSEVLSPLDFQIKEIQIFTNKRKTIFTFREL